MLLSSQESWLPKVLANSLWRWVEFCKVLVQSAAKKLNFPLLLRVPNRSWCVLFLQFLLIVNISLVSFLTACRTEDVLNTHFINYTKLIFSAK